MTHEKVEVVFTLQVTDMSAYTLRRGLLHEEIQNVQVRLLKCFIIHKWLQEIEEKMVYSNTKMMRPSYVETSVTSNIQNIIKNPLYPR